MTTRQLGRAQQERYIKELEAQGCSVRYGARGSKLVVRTPDGATTSIHFTTSDIKSLQASISWFRRHGLRHPDDTKEEKVEKQECLHESWEDLGGGARRCADCKELLPPEDESSRYPSYITSGTLSTKARTKALSTLRDLGWPLEIHAAALPMDATTSGKALYAIGYRWAEGEVARRGGPARVWHAPEEIRKLAAEAAKGDVQAPEPRPEPKVFGTGMPSPADVARNIARSQPEPPREEAWDQPTPPRVESFAAESERLLANMPVPRPTIPEMAKAMTVAASKVAPKPEAHPEREFIDTVDSWTVDNVPTAVKEYLDLLRGAGLQVEIRVWRKDS